MKTQLWREAFKIPKDSEHSLLEILRSGFISEDDYIPWASENYELPVVDHEFFKTITNYKLLQENPSPLWNETFFPAHEWENTLYIVCLEPQEIQLNKPHCFVLASLFRMETLWNKMEKPASVIPETGNKPLLESEEITADIQPLTIDEKISSPDFSFESLNHEPLSQDASPAQEAGPIQDTPPVQELPLQESPPPLMQQVDALFEEKAENSQISSFFSQSDSSTQISIPDFVIDELTKADAEPPPLYEDTRISVDHETTNVVAVKGPKPEITFTNTKTIVPFPERSTQFSFLRTVFSEQVILEARGKVKENTDPHQALICAFHILKDYYKKIMWAVRDQKGAVYPIASNTAWDFSEEAWNTPIDFKSPNPFRIAKFTAKPYHGEVYQNPINDRFFELWNGGKYPSVFTVTPIKFQGKVFAYLVGCEPGLHYHPVNSLDIMQATCDELIQTFLTIHKELSPPSKAS